MEPKKDKEESNPKKVIIIIISFVLLILILTILIDHLLGLNINDNQNPGDLHLLFRPPKNFVPMLISPIGKFLLIILIVVLYFRNRK